MAINNDLTQFLDEHIKKSNNTNIVDVFPIRCGVGKSTYIKHRIYQGLSTNEKLIIITDQISNLKDYIEVDELSEYINRNQDKFTLLTSDNIGTELKTLYLKNIVLMTTQRYFNSTVEEIKELTKNRKIIIFDEKPYFNEQFKITIKTFNDIDTALHIALDNTIEPLNKEWLVSQWELLRAKFQAIIREYEQQNINGKLETWHYKENDAISDNDERFINLINQYRLNLQKYDINSYKNILAIIQIVYEGATFTSYKVKSRAKEQKYENYFTVLMDNKTKLTNTGAKIYILDGTSDISPEYKISYVNLIDCSKFLLPLNKLIINCINLSTSRTRFDKADKNKYIECIADYIKSLPDKCDAVFTYQKIETMLKKHFDNVNHFGNIKGKNDYRDKTNIVQIGLNRYSDLAYILQASYNQLEKYNGQKVTIAASYTKVENVMYNTILADLEQNLYRTKIRNVDNIDTVTYTIFFNTNQYSRLIELLKIRYGTYGATINVIDTPLEFKLFKADERKKEKETSIQKFNKWLKSQPKGRVFRRADIKKECNITDADFKSLKNSGILNNFKTEKQGVYIVK